MDELRASGADIVGRAAGIDGFIIAGRDCTAFALNGPRPFDDLIRNCFSQ